MNMRLRHFASAVGVVMVGGCLGSAPRHVDGVANEPEHGRRSGSAITIAGEQLWGHGADLVTAMRSRVSGMQVKRSTSDCPQITIRGQKSMIGPSDPHVYVDGMQAVNTCILDMLSPADIERVEVYRAGITPRSGYPAHPYGLILVFSRGAAS